MTVCKQMTSDSFKNDVTNKLFAYKSYIYIYIYIYIYKFNPRSSHTKDSKHGT